MKYNKKYFEEIIKIDSFKFFKKKTNSLEI